jgi:hypothetical protein
VRIGVDFLLARAKIRTYLACNVAYWRNVEYLRAAELIAAHSDRCPDEPFMEDNLARLLESLIGESCGPMGFQWTFLIDDDGYLWAHPCSYGIEALRLTRNEPPSVDALRRALALDRGECPAEAGPVPGLRTLRSRLFAACSECKSPDFCIRYHGPKESAEKASSICVWRTELTSHLEKWLCDTPETARRIARSDWVGCLI